jgi:histidinol phosphatase-like PHP family hydrolase/predicted MPP superfamily phosphohydrolase
MTDVNELRLLVIADPHVVLSPRDRAAVPANRGGMPSLELLRRAIEDASARGGFDALALMGDVLNDGQSPDAEMTLRLVAGELARAGKDAPLLVVPGNHDGDSERLLRILGARTGGQEIGGYRFFVVADHYGDRDICTRSDADRQALSDWAAGGGPVVVLQHNPMNPAIDDPYPYMLTNRPQVMADYTRAGVMLSLSGHYHKGQAQTIVDGVRYFTAPAICEGDYPYCLVTLRGREVSIETRPLRLPAELSLVDAHAHTEFAYCGRDMSADAAIDRARRMGLAGVRLVEHAPQLYCLRDDFFRGRHVREPSLWRGREHCRAKAFRSAMLPRRDEFARIGLEVELDADGQLTLHDDDRWVDLLVGAIHFLPQDPTELSETQLAGLFMKTCEGLIRRGARVLAHPWRIFAWTNRRVPTELYGDLADLLASTGAAAEINFHGNWSDPAFFAKCLERGAKIALGSDAHQLFEVGSFGPHVEVLKMAAGTDDPAVLRSCLATI